MDRREIAQRVIAVTARELKLAVSEIREEDQFAADLGADSLKSIELVAAFEEEFGVSVNEEDALKVQSVGGAVDFFVVLLNTSSRSAV